MFYIIFPIYIIIILMHWPYSSIVHHRFLIFLPLQLLALSLRPCISLGSLIIKNISSALGKPHARMSPGQPDTMISCWATDSHPNSGLSQPKLNDFPGLRFICDRLKKEKSNIGSWFHAQSEAAFSGRIVPSLGTGVTPEGGHNDSSFITLSLNF